MSVLDFFRSSNPVPAAPASQPQNTNPSAANAANPSTNGNPAVPPVTQNSPGGNTPVTPQEPDFTKLWEAPAENEPTLPTFDPSKMFNLDPAKIAEAVKTIDYSRAINQEQLAAVTAGGEGAVAALAQIMNSVAQQTTQVSMMGAAKLVEQALGKANESLDARMQEQIRKNTISQELKSKNPVFSRPEYAPMVSALEDKFRMKYPTASASEITGMAEKYLLNFAQGITGKKEGEAANAVDDFDWGKHFGFE